MEMECAQCGCVVDRGWRLEACPDRSCCCRGLAFQTVERLGELVTSAMASGDLDELFALLAPDARWGAPEEPVPTCSNRDQIIDWYREARDAGESASVNETFVRGENIVVGLVLSGVSSGPEHRRRGELWQVLTVRDGRIAEIRDFDDRRDAEGFATSPVSRWVSKPPS
jgi:ketosteroid isomerase-like protein